LDQIKDLLGWYVYIEEELISANGGYQSSVECDFSFKDDPDLSEDLKGFLKNIETKIDELWKTEECKSIDDFYDLIEFINVRANLDAHEMGVMEDHL